MTAPDLTGTPVADLISLSGRVAVITGGARGIGEAIARRFVEAGASVLIGDLDEEAARATAARLSGGGGRVLAAPLDATDSASMGSLADRAVSELGRLDIWVNNAGIYPVAGSLDMSDADWDRVLDLNLRGTFIGAREAARRMASVGDGGVIINLSSVAGFRGTPGLTHYVASKHGVRGLTRSLAAELGPAGIRVLALAPTLIETPGVDVLRGAMSQAGADLSAITETLPLGRLGLPDDVARVALFCASDLSAFMTGSTLPVDGGQLAI